MSVINANPLMLGDAGYNIGRSLRFRSSASAYLSRTPASAGNRKTWTWSAWVKRGALAQKILFGFGVGGFDRGDIEFTASDNIFLNFLVGATTYSVTTSAVYRDPSAWYHIVVIWDTTQATASNRIQLYVNGAQVTAFSSTNYPTLNLDGIVNNNVAHGIGYYPPGTSAGTYFDGYLAEVNFIDGQALTPSSFGQTDAVTGVWTPKKYAGAYGTNGFYLPFSDNTSATTLAYDKSGNNNNWTPNNISTTSGATYDSMTDVPTLTSAIAANYCVLNPLHMRGSCTVSDGNLKGNIPSGTAATGTLTSTFAIRSGKFYWEVTGLSSNYYADIGLIADTISAGSMSTRSSGGVAYSYFDGSKFVNGTNSSYGSSFTYTDIIGVAIDADGGTVTFYKNNTSQGAITLPSGYSSWFPAVTTNTGSAAFDVVFNFGQRPFSYTPPTGFKALNTFNLPDPTIKKPNQYMDATTYTGNLTGQSVTNQGGFQPDLVWIKSRSAATDNKLTDAVRGATLALVSNSTSAETTDVTGLTAFNSNGFAVGESTTYNNIGATYVGWQWKKGATPGFDIVTYTGTGANRTIAHNLGVAPSMMIFKNRTTGGTTYGYWPVYHSGLGTPTKGLLLNTTDAAYTDATMFNSTAPTSSVFSIGTHNFINHLNDNYVAYLFAEIAGFSKFGSYTGNGSTDGPFVYCGFRPKYILWKQIDSARDWGVWTPLASGNGIPSNNNFYLVPDGSYAQDTTQIIDTLSNGFKQRDSGSFANANGGTYIYAAFAENPFKYSLAR